MSLKTGQGMQQRRVAVNGLQTIRLFLSLFDVAAENQPLQQYPLRFFLHFHGARGIQSLFRQLNGRRAVIVFNRALRLVEQRAHATVAVVLKQLEKRAAVVPGEEGHQKNYPPTPSYRERP